MVLHELSLHYNARHWQFVSFTRTKCTYKYIYSYRLWNIINGLSFVVVLKLLNFTPSFCRNILE